MDEEIKVDGDDTLFAFVDALGGDRRESKEELEADGQQQQQQQQQQLSDWTSLYGSLDSTPLPPPPPPPPLEPSAPSPPPPPSSGIDTYTSTDDLQLDIYTELTEAFDNWLTRLIDAGSHLTSTRVFKGTGITETINQMCADGLIGSHESYELRCIGNAWMRLLYAYQLYRTGCRNYKRRIIGCLLELFSSHLISEDLCADICVQL